eukprot:TRINITY_DN12779_c0_g1_i2.p1 TRINITY_DN12779_c0_g1~~TRINITY_DN12779_c0_g1_i2.p1  ORF type:complete len:149 (-),score=32.55 TRINITY_DN12779_c0_g1_i2:92-538(-)
MYIYFFFFFQAEDGIRDAQESRGLGDVYKRQVQLFLWAMSRTDMFLPMAVAACIAGTSHVITLLLLLHKEESNIRRRVQAEIAMMVLYGWPMALMALYGATLLCFPSYLVRSLVFLSTCIDTQSIGGKRRRLLSVSYTHLTLPTKRIV